MPKLSPVELMAKLDECKRANFASFIYTAKGTGEKAKHTLVLNAITENLYEKDIPLLEGMLSSATDAITRLALAEMIESKKESLANGVGNNSRYTNKDTYSHTPVRNVKMHKETGELYVSGLSTGKTVIIPGTYKVVESSEKTLAKQKAEKEIPSGKYRQFALGMISNVVMNGETIEIEVEVTE